jgi:hypothetical protein
MQAALETMIWSFLKPEFCTRENGLTTGECTERKRGTIKHEHGSSLYADDAVFFFNTKNDLENGASCIYEHLLKFGLTMHIGTGEMPSRTEAMYFPPPGRLYSDQIPRG